MSSTKIALREISSEIGMAFLWVGDWGSDFTGRAFRFWSKFFTYLKLRQNGERC